MSSQRDDVALHDVATACRAILAFAADKSFSDFLADAEFQSAVLYQLVVLGEAAKRLSPAFRSKHDAVAWREIAGMRDILVHQYHRLALRLVWGAVTRDVPAVLEYVDELLGEDTR